MYQDGPEGLFGDAAEALFARIKRINCAVTEASHAFLP